MFDLEIQRCTRRCAKSGEELKPGEIFYSALVPDGREVVRVDYGEEHWEGPPEDSLGWWKSEMPSPTSRKMHWAPNDVMMHYFEQLEGQADKQDIRYVLSLLMIRRRIVRLEDSETDEQGREVMVLYSPRSESELKVPVVEPSEARINEIQEELAQLLFGDAA